MSDRLDDLIRSFTNSGMSRRDFVKKAGALGLSIGAIGSILAACGGTAATPAATETAATGTTPTAAATETAAATATAAASATTAAGGVKDYSGQTLTIQVWAGSVEEAYKKDVFAAFENKFKCKVVSTAGNEYFDLSKIKQEIDSGDPQLDVSVMTPGDLLRGGNDGLFEKLADSEIKAFPDLRKDANMMPWGVGNLVYSYGIGMRTDTKDKFGKVPAKWADLWDPAYAKSITIGRTTPTYTIESMSIMLTGKATPVDLDAVFARLEELKPNIHSFTDTPATGENLLVNKEAYLYIVFDGRIWEMADRGLPVTFVLPEEGIYGACDFWSVTKGTKRRDLALEFINFTLEPEQQIAIAKTIHYGPTVSTVQLLSDVKAIYGDDQWAKLRFADPQYEAENSDAWTQRWTEWQAGL